MTQGCTALVNLYLRECRLVTNAVLIETHGLSTHCPTLCSFISIPNWPMLEDLSLSGCHKVGDGTLATLGHSCKNLRVLRVSDTPVSDLGYISSGPYQNV